MLYNVEYKLCRIHFAIELDLVFKNNTNKNRFYFYLPKFIKITIHYDNIHNNHYNISDNLYNFIVACTRSLWLHKFFSRTNNKYFIIF